MAKTRTFIAVEALDAVQTAALGVIDRLRGVAITAAPEQLRHFTAQFAPVGGRLLVD